MTNFSNRWYLVAAAKNLRAANHLVRFLLQPQDSRGSAPKQDHTSAILVNGRKSSFPEPSHPINQPCIAQEEDST